MKCFTLALFSGGFMVVFILQWGRRIISYQTGHDWHEQNGWRPETIQRWCKLL